MFINITDTVTADNKGSSGKLVNYLEKENRIYNKEEERWFNHMRQDIEPFEVRRIIDGNTSKLSNKDPKFFLINVSPSQKEIKHLIDRYRENGARDQLKEYAVKVMDEYAKNFKRPGINSSKDLVWFAKLENNRYYTHKDKEVKEGTKRRGELKRGHQMHIQIIVSRKDATNKIKLSPLNKSQGKNEEHSKRVGQFKRTAFIQSGESLFDKFFKYERSLNETMAYAVIQKHGNIKQREQLDMLEQGSASNYQSKSVANELIKDVAEGMFHTTANMLETVSKTAGSFLEILMEPTFVPVQSNPMDDVHKEKKKRKKRQSQRKSYGHRM
jgi:hypothetical protein